MSQKAKKPLNLKSVTVYWLIAIGGVSFLGAFVLAFHEPATLAVTLPTSYGMFKSAAKMANGEKLGHDIVGLLANLKLLIGK